MQYVRKEHYVPQFYLRKFANNKGLLHIYDFEKNNFFKQCPNNMCYKKDLYETKWGEDNSKFGEFVLQNCIEKKFGEYEIEFSNVLSKIVKLCTPLQSLNALILQGREKKIFFHFVVNMIVRNPQSMERLLLNKLEETDIEHDQIKDIYALFSDMGLDGMDALCLAAKRQSMLTCEVPNGFIEACIAVLENMNYTFLCVPDDLFITSDIPFCIGDDFIINENNKTGIYLALSPKVVVIFGNYKNSKKYRNRNICISKEQADKFNNFFVNNNHDKRFLIANSEMILKKYVDMIKQ